MYWASSIAKLTTRLYLDLHRFTTNNPYSIHNATSANTIDIDARVINAGLFRNENIAECVLVQSAIDTCMVHTYGCSPEAIASQYIRLRPK